MSHKYGNHCNFPPEICANESGSFAKHTLLNRFPHIINQIIADNHYGQRITQELNSLITEVLEGKIKPLEHNRSPDAALWNDCIAPRVGETWFDVPFLFAEMYFYRRILEEIGYFEGCQTDPYAHQKSKGFAAFIDQLSNLAQVLNVANEASTKSKQASDLRSLTLAATWANCADLSQLSISTELQGISVAAKTKSLLIDDFSKILQYIANHDFPLNRIDIILDNVGAELLSDLGLVTYLLSTNCVKIIILHCKSYPVFVSDATVEDVRSTIHTIRQIALDSVSAWGDQLATLMQSQRLTLSEHSFWTLPYYFREMPEALHQDLSHSDLIIIKGDANYRRLVDDRHWAIATPIANSVDYMSVPVLALRVLKSELLLGANPKALETLNLPKNWMVSGNYGLIQFIVPS
jgi:uncharacterized protein with ATP-grasp and redox domains